MARFQPSTTTRERTLYMRMMITIQFDPQHFEAISALIPKEQEHIRALMSKGTVEAIYVSADRTVVWLPMKGESREQLEQELSTFPLYPYMKPQFAPLIEG
jgi:muconolactone delta-isomerase